MLSLSFFFFFFCPLVLGTCNPFPSSTSSHRVRPVQSSQKVIREPGQITKAKSMANLALVNVRRPSSSDDETESESISDSGQSMSTVSSSSMEFLSPREKEQIAGDGFTDFCVADLSLLEFGREEIELAETGAPLI